MDDPMEDCSLLLLREAPRKPSNPNRKKKFTETQVLSALQNVIHSTDLELSDIHTSPPMETEENTGELLFADNQPQNGRFCDPLRHTEPRTTNPKFNISIPPLTITKPLAISPRPASPRSPRVPIVKSPRNRTRPNLRTRKGLRVHSITNDSNLQMFEIRDAIRDIEKGESPSNQNILKKNYSFTSGQKYSYADFNFGPDTMKAIRGQLTSPRSAFVPSLPTPRGEPLRSSRENIRPRRKKSRPELILPDDSPVL